MSIANSDPYVFAPCPCDLRQVGLTGTGYKDNYLHQH